MGDVEGGADLRSTRRWLALAIGALIPAGVFALLIALARTPALARWIADPMFFRRCLVVHVDLALLVWAYAFVAALYHLLPTRGPARGPAAGVAVLLALCGVVAMVLGAGVPGAEPVLTNYVPAIDHRVFGVGLGAFALGVALAFTDGRLRVGAEAPGASFLPPAARPGVRAAALCVLVALTTIAAAALLTPPGLPPRARNELVFWGGGHVLQVALQCAMLACWLVLLERALGRPVTSRRTASLLFGLLVLPTLLAPALLTRGTTAGLYRAGFTHVMRWGIFPATAGFALLAARALRASGRSARELAGDARVRGVLASVALTTLGFVLGALIRGSTTMVPAHYHAATGAVTVAFMTLTYPLLEALGAPVPAGRPRAFARWQPVLYGGSQALFAVGFAVAGAAGMARKAYGQEQHVRTAGEYVGLSLMGLGGVIAVAGGVGFLWVAVAAWRRRTGRVASEARSGAWASGVESTRSSD